MDVDAETPTTSTPGSSRVEKKRPDFRKALDDAPVLKNKRGEVVSKRQKRIIINLCRDVVRQNGGSNLTSRNKVAEKLCQSTGIGKRKIMEIISEYCTYGDVVAPPRTKTNTRTAFQKLDHATCQAIRRKVHSFFFRKQLPTLDKLIREINDDDNLPNLSRSTLSRILKDLNFHSTRRNRKSVSADRDDIICWRRKYLREIRKFRAERRKVFYLGETLFSVGSQPDEIISDPPVEQLQEEDAKCCPTDHPEDDVNCCSAVEIIDDSSPKELPKSTQNASNADERLIVLHIGNEDGFLNGGALVFESNKAKDINEFMNYEIFESWFQQILHELPPRSVIVLDNSAYHCRKFQDIPDINSKKSEILNWLLERSVSTPVDAVRAELLLLVDQHKPAVESYVVDEIAESNGHKVLRFPPYHNELNPIEFIWENIKQYITMNDKLYTFDNLKILLSEAISQITTENWNECVRHVIKTTEAEMWMLDNLIDDVVEPGVVYSSDSDSDD